MAVILLNGYRCECCGHEWYPRKEEPPDKCPRCQKFDWNPGGQVATPGALQRTQPDLVQIGQ